MTEGPEAVLSVMTGHIAKRMSGILMTSVDDFELNGPLLGSYGLDSMMGAEMRTGGSSKILAWTIHSRSCWHPHSRSCFWLET